MQGHICIKFGGLAPNDMLDSIGRFKFGSMVWYRHKYMYMHIVEISVDERHTAKSLVTSLISG